MKKITPLFCLLLSTNLYASQSISGFNGFDWGVSGNYILQKHEGYKPELKFYEEPNQITNIIKSLFDKTRSEKLGDFVINSKTFILDKRCNRGKKCPLVGGFYILEDAKNLDISKLKNNISQRYSEPDFTDIELGSKSADGISNRISTTTKKWIWIGINDATVTLRVSKYNENYDYFRSIEKVNKGQVFRVSVDYDDPLYGAKIKKRIAEQNAEKIRESQPKRINHF